MLQYLLRRCSLRRKDGDLLRVRPQTSRRPEPLPEKHRLSPLSYPTLRAASVRPTAASPKRAFPLHPNVHLTYIPCFPCPQKMPNYPWAITPTPWNFMQTAVIPLTFIYPNLHEERSE